MLYSSFSFPYKPQPLLVIIFTSYLQNFSKKKIDLYIIVSSPSDLSQDFTKEVQEFCKVLYRAGHSDLEGRLASHGLHDKGTDFNPYQLMVHANGAVVDLLVWSIREESGKTVQLFGAGLLHVS